MNIIFKSVWRFFWWILILKFEDLQFFLRGVGQSLPFNSNNSVLSGISKFQNVSKFHTKQCYLNSMAQKTDPPLLLTILRFFQTAVIPFSSMLAKTLRKLLMIFMKTTQVRCPFLIEFHQVFAIYGRHFLPLSVAITCVLVTYHFQADFFTDSLAFWQGFLTTSCEIITVKEIWDWNGY